MRKKTKLSSYLVAACRYGIYIYLMRNYLLFVSQKNINKLIKKFFFCYLPHMCVIIISKISNIRKKKNDN